MTHDNNEFTFRKSHLGKYKQPFFYSVGFFLALSIYYFRLDNVVGMVNDDAWYVLLAKSLAEGKGYVLINSPTDGITPLYPPMHPLLLSLCWRLFSNFPQNVVFMKMLSVSAMIGSSILVYLYAGKCAKRNPLCSFLFSISLLASPAFVFLATSTVMSECSYLFFQLLAIVASEFALRNLSNSKKFLALAVIAASAAFLIRSFGVAVVIGTIVYFLINNQRKLAVLYCVSVAILIAPWLIYSKLHKPTPAQISEQRGFIVYGYEKQFFMKKAGDVTAGKESVLDLPQRVWRNSVNVIVRDIVGFIAPAFLRSAEESGQEVLGLGYQTGLGGSAIGNLKITMAFSLILSLVISIGLWKNSFRQLLLGDIVIIFTIGLAVMWPWWTFRFILPVLPFIIINLVNGLEKISAMIFRPSVINAVSRVVLMCIIGLYEYDNISYSVIKVEELRAKDMIWESSFKEARELFLWVNKNLPADTSVASTSPALVYLFTTRKTVAIEKIADSWAQWKMLGIRYVVITTPFGVTELDDKVSKYPVIYQTPSRLRVIDLGNPITRDAGL